MAEIQKAIKVGDIYTNLVEPSTGKSVNYQVVTEWYDGTPMDDSKADGDLYRKVGSEYVRKVIDKDGELFLEKDTVAQLRGLSSYEALLLKAGVYKGVTLNGYYEKGDTPAPIIYYLSDTVEEDDGGSIIEVGGIKLEHRFIGNIDIRYFGASTSPEVINNDIFINKLIQYTFVHKNVIEVPEGEFFVSDSIKGIDTHGLKLIGRGIRVTTISAAVEMDVLLDLDLSSNTSNIDIRGIRFNGRRLTNKTAHINNCPNFILNDVRFQGGDVGLHLDSSWSYEINKVTCIYNRIGALIRGQTTVNNNGTIRNSGFFLNDEVGLILVSVRDMKFSNTLIETNKKLGLYIGAAVRGVSFDSVYLEYNGDEGVDVNYQDGIKTVYNQIIVNGGSPWLGEGVINPHYDYTPHTIIFNNMLVVKRESGINEDTINVLNGESIYINSCWSSGYINLVVFKDSQLTSLNNLVTNNNFSLGGGEVLKIDYTNTRIRSRSNAKTWYLGEVLDTVMEDISISEYVKPTNVNLSLVGQYLGYDVFEIDVVSSSSLNVTRVLSSDLLNSKRLYYSILYKSEGTFNIVTVEGGVQKIKNFPASPDGFSEATLVLPDNPSTDVTISIGIYGAEGTVEVTKPEIGVIGNPNIKPDFFKLATQAEVNSGTDNSKSVTPLTLQTKLDNLSATPAIKGLVNQSAASADTATSPSETYTQAEVQAILTELRDLKTKLRTAGILAT